MLDSSEAENSCGTCGVYAHRGGTYGFNVRHGGTYFPAGKLRCSGLYKWTYHRQHPQPDRAVITKCPMSYLNPHAAYGQGFNVGSHFMTGPNYIGSRHSLPIGAFTTIWRGANVTLGDGSVR